MPWVGRIRKGYTYLVFNKFKENNIDLSRDQFILLKTLVEKDGQMQNDLACATERDKTSLARLIDTMQKKGLVKRKASTQDARANIVFLTKQGKETFQKALPLLKEVAENSQYDISKEEIKKTIEILKKLHHNINNYHEIK